MNPSVHPCWLLLSLTFMVWSELVYASNGLENMRIFYTAEERHKKDADSDGLAGIPSTVSDSVNDYDALKEPDGIESIKDAVAAPARGPQLKFDAVLRQNNRYVIVVNDLPCRTKNQDKFPQQLIVLCAHDDSKKLRLILGTGSKQLIVYSGTSKLATLSVGERL